jgi:SAM-dependent methyltransferase
VIDGMPVLLNEKASIFSTDQFLAGRSTTLPLITSPARRMLSRWMPTIGSDLKASRNYEKLTSLLCHRSTVPRVLVIGGSIVGQGMDPLLLNPTFEFVETDVSLGPRTMLICDAHDIPFADNSFDGVIAQAVLEHVADPQRCVEEIHRVLKLNAFVYAETPFIQQVHGGAYDFTRFTHVGHRRLFRNFDEIESGAVCGPGMALAWSYQYFLLSFTSSKVLRDLIKVFTRLTAFWLKYFDYYLIDRPGALDAASGYYFIGQKTDTILSDRELIGYYRGAFNS